ncbi:MULTISPECIES: hypothetical protein [unclassified Rathayibacter]|uniref:hypothetical protein n=1 Tax=unclassified Rathayibacter TaxID=2609250 RepID=UPI0011B08F50|nr:MULTISPECIES: hypothetical protein [unclassified Rathayibacter]
MNGIKEFRRVMAFAGHVARRHGVAVSPEHVAFALAATEPARTPASRAVIEYGARRGWQVQPEPPSVRQRLLPARRPDVEPRLQREIERAAAGGSPDVRTVLRSFVDSGELASVGEMVESAGQTLHEWLGHGDG